MRLLRIGAAARFQERPVPKIRLRRCRPLPPPHSERANRETVPSERVWRVIPLVSARPAVSSMSLRRFRPALRTGIDHASPPDLFADWAVIERGGSQHSSRSRSWAKVYGLVRKASMPAARHRCSSPSMALAVTAMIGNRRLPGRGSHQDQVKIGLSDQVDRLAPVVGGGRVQSHRVQHRFGQLLIEHTVLDHQHRSSQFGVRLCVARAGRRFDPPRRGGGKSSARAPCRHTAGSSIRRPGRTDRRLFLAPRLRSQSRYRPPGARSMPRCRSPRPPRP